MTDLHPNEGSLTAKDGLNLFRRTWLPPDSTPIRAHVALVHGYSDHSGRYGALVDALVRAGIAVHGFDYRGHGRSDGRRGHCDAFSQYHDDLEVFLAHVKPQLLGKRLFVFSHSHGGLIVASFAIARGLEGVAGLVFSAPFLRLAFSPPRFKVLAARVLNRIIPFFPIGNELKVEQLSRDTAWNQETARDPLYGHTTTPRWFAQALKTQLEVLARANEIRTPCLVLHGSADPIAAPAATQEFFAKLGASDKKLTIHEGFLHELANDLGKERVLAEVAAWIGQRM